MTELANFVANGMPGNYNALAGYAMNPYDPRRDPRTATADGRPVLNTGGSSSGGGTAANFWAANVGTETSGSILSPANQNMLAAIKPTVGRISRYGVIPITADQDTAGPMAKTVADVAILMGVARRRLTRSERSRHEDMPGAAEPRLHAVPQERGVEGRAHRHSARELLRRHHAARRQGTARRPQRRASEGDGGGDRNPEKTGRDGHRRRHSQRGRQGHGQNNFLQWGGSCGKGPREPNCSSVLWYGMKRDFNAWLASLGPAAPVKTLAELREFNSKRTNRNAIKYGQTNLDRSDELDLEKDRAKWEADRKKDIQLAATHGIDAALKLHKLDALVFPGAGSAGIAAKPGYPTVIVPFALVTPVPPANAIRILTVSHRRRRRMA